MQIFQVDLANPKQKRDFLNLPGRIYREIPQWVPPIERDERLRLDREHYPYF
jgi:hypothetical protein